MNNSSSTPSSLAPLDRSSWKRVRLGEIGTFAKGIPFAKTDLLDQGKNLAISCSAVDSVAVVVA